ncbi:MAG: hypothetical protein ACK6D4_15325, partial [Planctomyces sp.]
GTGAVGFRHLTGAVQPGRGGKVLESFEILGYESVEDRPTFRVRVGLRGEGVVEDTFVIVGNNPLLVFRKQDFDKAGGL